MSIFKFYTFKNEKRKDKPQPQLLTSSDEATPAKPTDPRELFGGLFKTNGQLKLTAASLRDFSFAEGNITPLTLELLFSTSDKYFSL